jgi:hypothetical protein
VAYECLDAHDGGNCNCLGLYIDWHLCQIDCDQLGSCIDEYIGKSIAISLDHVSMDVDSGFDGGFDGGFNGGFNGQFHLAVLGYQPQRSVQQLSREAFTAINQEGLTGLLLNKLVVF